MPFLQMTLRVWTIENSALNFMQVFQNWLHLTPLKGNYQTPSTSQEIESCTSRTQGVETGTVYHTTLGNRACLSQNKTVYRSMKPILHNEIGTIVFRPTLKFDHAFIRRIQFQKISEKIPSISYVSFHLDILLPTNVN